MKNSKWPLIIFCLMSHTIFAQNNFNVGISLGPALSITSLPRSDHYKEVKPVFISGINYHLGITAQYLFQDKFGLETGFNVSTRQFGIRTPGMPSKQNAYWDSFSFPFLLNAGLSYPGNPYRKITIIAGTTIEYQNYIRSSINLMLEKKINNFVPTITCGSRISFRQGELGKIDFGFTFNYAINAYYSYQLRNDGNQANISLSPHTHFLKFDLIYFFLNTKTRSRY